VNIGEGRHACIQRLRTRDAQQFLWSVN
jgi:hypothetical protein